MRQLRGMKPAQEEELTTIGDFADRWEVSTKTVENWTEIIYLGFDIHLPKSGPFPEWGVKLLEILAKHISQKATLYFAETQESRRLKSSEFISKIRLMRKDGHFAEFQKFRKFQDAPQLQPEDDDDLETLAELAAIARQQDQQLNDALKAVDAREDEQIEKFASFIENAETRRMNKLARRLKTRAIGPADTSNAIDVTFGRVD
jgi:GAF domain-containing protein